MVAFVHNDPPKLLLGNNIFRDDVFTAAGANTYPAGTVLARDTASSKLVVYVSGGSGGEEVPTAILRNELITTGSGDTKIRSVIAGEARLDQVTEFGGTTLTILERDELKNASGIILLEDNDLSVLDNST